MTHKTPDEIRRLVQTRGIFPALDSLHPQFILDDPRLAHLWGEANKALREAQRQADDIVRYLRA